MLVNKNPNFNHCCADESADPFVNSYDQILLGKICKMDKQNLTIFK